MTLKVLIVNTHFPGHGGTRIDKFVKYLPSFGVEPVVLSAKETRSDLTNAILKSRFPSWLQAHAAGSIGWTYFAERYTSRGPEAKYYTLLKYLSLPERFFYVPDRMIRWIPAGLRTAEKLVREQNIDVVLTSSPSESTHLIGLKLQQRLGIRWVADFRDLWTTKAVTYRPATSIHDRYIRKLERKIMTAADHIIANTDDNLQHYVRAFGVSSERVSMIPNGFDRADLDGTCELEKQAGVFYIGYMGNLDKHDFPWREFFRVLKRLGEYVGPDKVRFVQCGHQSNEVSEYLRQHGMEKYLLFHGMLPHDEAVRLIAGTDLRLLLLYDTEYSRAIVPAKLYNYLIMDGPIYALAPERSTVADILTDTGTGVVISPHRKDEEMYQLLFQQYQNWQQGAGNADVNLNEVSRYDRKLHTKALSDILRGTTDD